MADLNDEHSWPQIASLQYRGQTSDAILGAFLGKSATKVKIPGGSRLCRGSFGKSLGDPVTAWWSYFAIPSGAQGAGNDVGFATRVSFARTLGITVREVIRVFLAVSEDWNSLEWLVRIRLTGPVWGFYGVAGKQERLHTGKDASGKEIASNVKEGEGKGLTKNLPGIGYQLYIPFLTAKHFTMEDSLEFRLIESGLETPV
jgi:hypothetical protein